MAKEVISNKNREFLEFIDELKKASRLDSETKEISTMYSEVADVLSEAYDEYNPEDLIQYQKRLKNIMNLQSRESALKDPLFEEDLKKAEQLLDKYVKERFGTLQRIASLANLGAQTLGKHSRLVSDILDVGRESRTIGRKAGEITAGWGNSIRKSLGKEPKAQKVSREDQRGLYDTLKGNNQTPGTGSNMPANVASSGSMSPASYGGSKTVLVKDDKLIEASAAQNKLLTDLFKVTKDTNIDIKEVKKLLSKQLQIKDDSSDQTVLSELEKTQEARAQIAPGGTISKKLLGMYQEATSPKGGPEALPNFEAPGVTEIAAGGSLLATAGYALKKGWGVLKNVGKKTIPKLAKGKFAGPLSLALSAGTRYMEGQDSTQIAGGTASEGVGMLGGAAAGAMAGGALGSVVPGVGNAVGAAVGGLVGGIAGGLGGGALFDSLYEPTKEVKASEKQGQKLTAKLFEKIRLKVGNQEKGAFAKAIRLREQDILTEKQFAELVELHKRVTQANEKNNSQGKTSEKDVEKALGIDQTKGKATDNTTVKEKKALLSNLNADKASLEKSYNDKIGEALRNRDYRGFEKLTKERDEAVAKFTEENIAPLQKKIDQQNQQIYESGMQELDRKMAAPQKPQPKPTPEQQAKISAEVKKKAPNADEQGIVENTTVEQKRELLSNFNANKASLEKNYNAKIGDAAKKGNAQEVQRLSKERDEAVAQFTEKNITPLQKEIDQQNKAEYQTSMKNLERKMAAPQKPQPKLTPEQQAKISAEVKKKNPNADEQGIVTNITPEQQQEIYENLRANKRSLERNFNVKIGDALKKGDGKEANRLSKERDAALQKFEADNMVPLARELGQNKPKAEVAPPPTPTASTKTSSAARSAQGGSLPNPTPTVPAKAGPTPDIGQMQSEVMGQLQKEGITDPKAVSNVMAQLQAESAFKPKSENLNYSPQTLMRLFGPGNEGGNKVRVGSLEEAQAVVKRGPEAVGNLIYGGRMGNAPDEGFKYRGRGLVQLTGKENYDRIGEKLGIDLVSNPDLANDPKYAPQIAAAYYADRGKGKDLTDINQVSKITGHATGAAGNAQRAEYAQAFLGKIKGGQIQPAEVMYASNSQNSQDSLANLSKEYEMAKNQPTIVPVTVPAPQVAANAPQPGVSSRSVGASSNGASEASFLLALRNSMSPIG